MEDERRGAKLSKFRSVKRNITRGAGQVGREMSSCSVAQLIECNDAPPVIGSAAFWRCTDGK